MRQSVSKGQEEGFARREGWSSATSDRRAERSVKDELDARPECAANALNQAVSAGTSKRS
jgi:hypothetical protein